MLRQSPSPRCYESETFQITIFCVSDLESNLIATYKSRDLKGLKRSLRGGESGRSNGLM